MEGLFYVDNTENFIQSLIEIQQNRFICYLSTNKQKISTQLKLCADTKFTKLQISLQQKQLYGIRIYNSSQQLIFYSFKKELVDQWSNYLSTKIYRTGFQEQLQHRVKIGKGAFASVYKITDHNNNVFAAKSFEIENINKSQKNYRVFHNQVNLMRMLKHEHLIQFQTVYLTEETFQIAMQYCQGYTLQSFLTNRIKVSEQQQQTIMYQLLKALKQLKRLNIIHRDLKLQNIFLKYKDPNKIHCVIADFGLATISDDSYILKRCGTPGFISPEIVNCRDQKAKFTVAADMFSLGAIFYKIISGYDLFKGKNMKLTLANNRLCKIDFSSPSFLKFNEFQLDLIKRMLEKDPKNRITPQDALNHKYFKTQEQMELEQIPDQQNDIISKIKKLAHTTNFQSISSLSSYASQNSFNSCNSINSIGSEGTYSDSCITFQNLQAYKNMQQCKIKKRNNNKRKSRFSILNEIKLS